MKILVACEFSGIVRDAFLRRGHNAISCDLLDTERPGPHIRGDVTGLLDRGWDLLIAHPPARILLTLGCNICMMGVRALRKSSVVAIVLLL